MAENSPLENRRKPTSRRSFFFEDLGSSKNIIDDLNKPKVRRMRTFTGKIQMSLAGLPGYEDPKKKLFWILLGLFLFVDIVLVICLVNIL